MRMVNRNLSAHNLEDFWKERNTSLSHGQPCSFTEAHLPDYTSTRLHPLTLELKGSLVKCRAEVGKTSKKKRGLSLWVSSSWKTPHLES